MAVETPIPPAICALLNDSILSIEELEVLMRLRIDRAARTAVEVADALNIPELVAEKSLENLKRAGFLSSVSHGKRVAYEFAPHREDIAASFEALVAYYRDNRVQVILTISNNAIERMRHGVLQRFSDAFRISLDKKDD